MREGEGRGCFGRSGGGGSSRCSAGAGAGGGMWRSIEKEMPSDVAGSTVRRALGRRAEGVQVEA